MSSSKRKEATESDTPSRIAIVDSEKCKPNKCRGECKKSCPVVRMGKRCIEVTPKSTIAYISEELCIGCGICVKKCPFSAITIINLPKNLEKETTHRYGPNSFKLHRLPMPRTGQVLGLVGTNGIGKSTAMKILGGKLKPNLGMFNDPPDWQEILAYFRGSELQNYFTRILEDKMKTNIKPQYVDHIPRAVQGVVEDVLKSQDERDVVEEILQDMDLAHVRDRDIEVLSGGELQRFAISAVAVQKCDCYMFDEPSSYLDVRQRIRAAKVIRELLDVDPETYVVTIDHDLAVQDYLSDYICVLYGTPGVYGVVTMPYAVRDGINVFLAGYIPTENMRFRDEALTFKVATNLEDNRAGGDTGDTEADKKVPGKEVPGEEVPGGGSVKGGKGKKQGGKGKSEAGDEAETGAAGKKKKKKKKGKYGDDDDGDDGDGDGDGGAGDSSATGKGKAGERGKEEEAAGKSKKAEVKKKVPDENELEFGIKIHGVTRYPAMSKTLVGKKKAKSFKLNVEAGTFRDEEIVVMLGENGTGKSTFIRMLAGLLEADDINEEDTEEEKAKKGLPVLNVSYKPQKIAPKFQGTVRELLMRKIKASFLHPQFNTDVLKPMMIDAIIDQEVQNLSGGELQRVALTVCLGKPADVYLIDEPSAYLDSEQRISAARMIKKFILHAGKTAFIVEHDFIMATYLADRVIVYEGRPGEEATARSPETLLTGMNRFLESLHVTFRRDPTNYRPRINKLGSAKDVEQKKSGNYFYLED